MKMIPPNLDSSVKSNAERKIFNIIEKIEIEGYCFHSVGIANHEYKPYAEADFILLTRKGVLCLEIKGGVVGCNDGVWQFINRYGEINYKNQGPYDQAVGAMYAVKEKVSPIRNTNFACGVVFPDIEFESTNISVIDAVTCDIRNLNKLNQFIDNCYSYWNKRFNNYIPELNDVSLEAIREQIREDLHYAPALKLLVDSTEEEIIRLTKQQVEVLNAIVENEKILVSGVAGAGKTLVALEYAKKMANNGDRVLFVTYNKLLAKYLMRKNKIYNIIFISIHELMSQYIPIDIDSNIKNYYDEVLPNKFYKYLSSHKLVGYDVLVLDEGQDLLKDAFLLCFDKLIKGGFAYGKWNIFYDSNQNLFNPHFNKNLIKIKKFTPVQLKLTKNCRNSKQIAEFNQLLTGINTGVAIVEGEKIKILSSDNMKILIRDINLKLKELLSSGFDFNDIIILSPVTYTNSVCYNSLNVPVVLSPHIESGIKYYTIQSFKGLDSKVVLFVDYDSAVVFSQMQLLYTSLSRARCLAYVFVYKETEQKIQQLLIENISAREE